MGAGGRRTVCSAAAVCVEGEGGGPFGGGVERRCYQGRSQCCCVLPRHPWEQGNMGRLMVRKAQRSTESGYEIIESGAVSPAPRYRAAPLPAPRVCDSWCLVRLCWRSCDSCAHKRGGGCAVLDLDAHARN